MSSRIWLPTWGALAIVAVFGAGCVDGNEGGESGDAEERRVVLQVRGLDSQDAEDAVRRVLKQQSGVNSVSVDRTAGRVSFKLAASGSIGRVVSALTDAGYAASEPGDEATEHPEHPEKSEDPEHPEHPEKSEDPEHPKKKKKKEPDHPDHPK